MEVGLPISLYWIFRLGFRSSLAMFRPSEAMYWMNISWSTGIRVSYKTMDSQRDSTYQAKLGRQAGRQADSRLRE